MEELDTQTVNYIIALINEYALKLSPGSPESIAVIEILELLSDL